MRRKVLVRGPALSRSGYGEHTRFLLRALRSREDLFDIYLLNLNWGKTGWIWEDDEERRWIDSILYKTMEYVDKGRAFDISALVTIPNEFEKLAPINIGVTAGIETTKVSPQWIEKSQLVDKIVTVSNHSKDVYENTKYEVKNEETGEVGTFGCMAPIEVVHYPVRDYEPENIELNLDYDFNFLAVAQVSPRKNTENLIRWFVEEFYDKKVGLVLKCNVRNNSTLDKLYLTKIMSDLLREYDQRECKIYLIHGDMHESELTALYQHPKIKALISLSHGEGFGLPIFEAAYNELPIIAPNWSGYVDFLYAPVKDKKTKKEKLKAHFAKVKYTIKPVQKEAVWDGVIQKDSMWCYPEQGSFKMRLRELRRDHSRFKSQAKKLAKHIRENFTEEKQYEKFVNIFSAGMGEEDNDIIII